MTDPVIYTRQSKKWPAGTRTFRSSVTHDGDRGAQLYLPKPISDLWGNPSSIIFQMQGDQVVVRKGKKI